MYKTAISNICWGNTDDNIYLEKAVSLGAYGIEVAPSVFWKEPVLASSREREDYKRHIEGFGLKIVSLHALFYTRPDLKLFEDKDAKKAAFNYLIELGYLARDLGAPLMVMGSPKMRKRGSLSKEEALKHAALFFHDVSEKLKDSKTILCIEPLDESISDFLNNHKEALELVKMVNHPNFQIMLDVKSMYSAKEDYFKAFKDSEKFLKHIHVNDPGNTAPDTHGVDHEHVAEALGKIEYKGALSLEVSRSEATPMENLDKGFQILNEVYCHKNYNKRKSSNIKIA